ncbi:MAG: hypothetical protein Q9183_003806 [Haloplaca sp. 2 TL-2023]
MDLPADTGSNIIYNRHTNLWSCCSSDSTDCRTPKDRTFHAPSPQSLKVLKRLKPRQQHPPPTITSTIPLIRLAHETGEPTTTLNAADRNPTSTVAGPPNLSSGQKAGVGIGGAILFFTLFGAIYFLICKYWSRRDRRRESEDDEIYNRPDYSRSKSRRGLPDYAGAGGQELNDINKVGDDSGTGFERIANGKANANGGPRDMG